MTDGPAEPTSEQFPPPKMIDPQFVIQALDQQLNEAMRTIVQLRAQMAQQQYEHQIEVKTLTEVLQTYQQDESVAPPPPPAKA
jgi:hypothetical protein